MTLLQDCGCDAYLFPQPWKGKFKCKTLAVMLLALILIVDGFDTWQGLPSQISILDSAS